MGGCQRGGVWDLPFPVLLIWSILALRVPAGGADETPLLIDEHIAAFGALSGKVLGQAVVLRPGLALVAGGMLFQYAGDSIGAREDGLAFLPGDGRAADAAELLHD